MTMDPSAQPGAFAERKAVSDEEVRALRAQMWSDGSISPDEAERLFAINANAGPSREWTDFFVEAITDYLVSRGEPRGYVTNSDADWLIGQVSRDGRIETNAELELIVKLLERADFAPEGLRQFALAEIECTVLTGSGSTRRGGDLTPGRIDPAETALLRRLLFAPAGDAPARISRTEAEMLFRLKDATLGAANCPEWPRLFVQGVANYLMARETRAPSREDGLRFGQAREADTFGTLARMGREIASASEVVKALAGDEAARAAAHDSAVARDANVTRDESSWLHRLFEGDGARDSLEVALLDFLAEEGARPS